MNWNKLLENRVAIITGAASGVGRAAAILFASHGARVLVADIDEDGARHTVSTLRDAGGEAIFVKTDVSSAVQTQAMALAALENWGAIDILYNNAAATTLCNKHDRAVHELEENVWDATMAITLKSVYMCSKACLPTMINQGRGVILNTSSTDAVLAEPGFDAYTAAKGATISLTRGMAAEYGPRGIRVNVISPGYIATECQMPWINSDPKALAAAEAAHALKRLGAPEEVANAALFLVSDLSAFITGALIPVDGGYSAFKVAAPFDQNKM